MSEAVSGSIERVTFFNADNGFAILRVAAPGRRELATVLCHLPTVQPGEWLEAQGEWQRDRDHGLQFKASEARTVPPHSHEGLVRFLGGGLIKGVGPVFARKLVAKFGEKILDVIEHESGRLEDIPGVGPERRRRIKAAWTEQRQVRDIMLFLYQHGASTARAQRIYKTYGEQAVEVVQRDPYQLARDIHGIGFRTADGIAAKLGLRSDAPVRLAAGLRHALREASAGEGHAALPRAELLAAAAQLLDAPELACARELEACLQRREFVLEQIAGEPLVFLPPLHAAERGIAERVRRLAAAPRLWPELDAAAAAAQAERETGRTLSPSQRAALGILLGARLAVLTGGPGVGKTTLLDAWLRLVAARGARVVLAAPTGRAAQRLNQATGQPAATLHRLLEWRGEGFERHEGRPLEGDIFVVDESSMLDLPLAHAFLRAIPPEGAVLFVGDVDQLPSVGPGLVLRSLIDSGAVPVARLTEIFRQAAESGIVTNAHRINSGELPIGATKDATSGDFFLIERAESAEVAATVEEVVARRLPARFGLDPRRDIQVLAPMNRGVCGTRELNRRLQAVLNPPREGGLDEVERFGWTFRTGDRVIQLQNNYDKEVFNGDIGRITRVEADDRELRVAFEGREREVVYDFNELDELGPASAITIHKSQGSEFAAVVIPLAAEQYLLLQRNLLYTAVTRGKRLVVVVAQRKALRRAVSETSARTRRSGLLERLRAE
ncbi:MAG: ATP-dependent RecD-like DNA helicase [Verrucomicrobia bacterium]|nr:ATP-dependent RecD-like DNA helicase [Verrucomicrobiota bacterium]